MASVTQIDATLGETFDSGTVTRSIAVTAAAAADLHLLVQPAADAAPTADTVIAQGLDAPAVASSTFSAAGLASESDYVAYAVAKTGPTGSYQVTSRGEIASHDEYDTNKTGFSVSASADGSTIAVAIPGYDTPTPLSQANIGAIRVYDWTGGAWQHRAPDMIVGSYAHTWAGGNVRISADGNTVVCTGDLNSTSYVRRFDWDGSTWNQTSSLLNSNATSFGLSLDASDDCSVIVVGAPMNNNTAGTFHIYTWDGTTYVERLSADTHGSKQGSEVAVSGDGNVVAVGGLFLNPYHIKVYQRNSGDTFGLKYTVGSSQHPGTSIALNSDGSLLAVATSNRVEVYKWTTDYYALQRSFSGTANFSYMGGSHLTHAQSIQSGYPPQYDLMSFGGAPGEELLCVTESNWPQMYGIVRIFEANTGTPIKQLTGGNNSEYGRAVSLSNDGKVVIIGAPEFHRVYTYDISDGSSTSAVATQAFTTGDFTAPVVTAQIAGNARKNAVDIAVASSEDGTAYFAVAASAPSAAAVRASGTSAAITTAGLAAQTVPNLVSGTTQTAYVVVEDASGNLSLVHPVSYTTPVPAFTQLSAGAATFEGVTLTFAADTLDGTAATVYVVTGPTAAADKSAVLAVSAGGYYPLYPTQALAEAASAAGTAHAHGPGDHGGATTMWMPTGGIQGGGVFHGTHTGGGATTVPLPDTSAATLVLTGLAAATAFTASAVVVDAAGNTSALLTTPFTTTADKLAAIADAAVRSNVRAAVATAGTAQERFKAAKDLLVAAAETGWAQIKATARQVLDEVAAPTADVAKDDVVALVAMPALPEAIATVRMGRTTVQLTEAEAASTASMLLMEGAGDVATVEMTKTSGGSLFWRVTKSGGGPYTYAVETSTDGVTYSADGGGAHNAGDTLVSTIDGYAATLVFNDPVVTVSPPSSSASADPYVKARFT